MKDDSAVMNVSTSNNNILITRKNDFSKVHIFALTLEQA